MFPSIGPSVKFDDGTNDGTYDGTTDGTEITSDDASLDAGVTVSKQQSVETRKKKRRASSFLICITGA